MVAIVAGEMGSGTHPLPGVDKEADYVGGRSFICTCKQQYLWIIYANYPPFLPHYIILHYTLCYVVYQHATLCINMMHCLSIWAIINTPLRSNELLRAPEVGEYFNFSLCSNVFTICVLKGHERKLNETKLRQNLQF